MGVGQAGADVVDFQFGIIVKNRFDRFALRQQAQDQLHRDAQVANDRLAATGSGYVIALYILFCAVVSIVTTAFLPDRTNLDISQEDAYGATPEPARQL